MPRHDPPIDTDPGYHQRRRQVLGYGTAVLLVLLAVIVIQVVG